jgi:hypothetical protein
VRSTSPNFDDWRALTSIKIWEIAALMNGFDPRAMTDVAIRDPNSPTSHHGVSPDLNWEIRQLISAVNTSDLITAPAGTAAPNGDTGILKTSLVSWLQKNRFVDLADELNIFPQSNSLTLPETADPSAQISPSPERRLKALRDLGGQARWLGRNSGMKWRFTKIKALAAQEKNTKQPRCDEKTIRKDLTEAAEAENQAKSRL